MTPFPSEYTPTGDDLGNKFSPADIFFKYLAHLPLFLVSLALCVAAGLLYLRYKTPKFTSTVQMLVKSGESNPVYGKQGDIVERALYGPREINMSNEIQKLRSVQIISRAVAKNNLHIQYFNEGNIKTSNLFNKVPFRLNPVDIVDSNRLYRIRFGRLNPQGFTLMRGDQYGEVVPWGQNFSFDGALFNLSLNPGAQIVPTDQVQVATFANPYNRATEILNQLTIYVADPNTTILTFSIVSDNLQMGTFILDRLVEEYIVYSRESKNEAALATISFINERLDSLANELRALEANINSYSDQSDVLPISEQASLFSARLSDAEQQINRIDWQVKMLGYTEDYIRSPKNRSELVPSALGLEDPTIEALIGTFNSLRLERKKEAEQQVEGSLPLKQIDQQLKEIERSLLERFSTYRKLLLAQRSDLQQKNAEYTSYLSNIPFKQRRQLELERQQKVKEGLYMYLLQRKEEIAITTKSTDPGYAVMNPASGSIKPLEPDAAKIRTFAIIIGLLIPIGIIYLKDLLNDKITTRDDISKQTSANIIGEVGHVDDNRSLVVADNSRNIISEQFRIIRSNLAFLMNQKPFQTILVTSTISGEGKSFVSINLAAVLSLAGKRVALLEFDLRRPRIMQNLALTKSKVGISNILLGLSKPEDVFVALPGYPDLHIYQSGIVPPNPAELVLSNNNKMFFDYLKGHYDYIIIDSAPVGLVSDSFSLAPFIDTSLYVIRHRYTFKRQIKFIDDIFKSGKLPYLWLVVNDLKMGARFGYYGYGYGYGYGAGYSYSGGSYTSYGADAYYDVSQPKWRRALQNIKKSFRV